MEEVGAEDAAERPAEGPAGQAGDERSQGPWWQVALLVEATLVVIAALLPVAPGRNGEPTRPGHWFFENAGYLEDFVVNLVALHVIVIIFVGIAIVLVRRDRRRAERGAGAATPTTPHERGGSSMAKQLKCADVGPDCTFVARADTEEELLELVVEHAARVHGIHEITPDLAAKVKSAIHDA